MGAKPPFAHPAHIPDIIKGRAGTERERLRQQLLRPWGEIKPDDERYETGCDDTFFVTHGEILQGGL